jgi:Flp pilus assembly protein TadD
MKGSVNRMCRLTSKLRTEVLISLFLVIATALTYSRSCVNDFVNFDDPGYVIDNPNVKAGFSAASLWWDLKATECTNWHPLTWLSLQLDYELYGLEPWGYHLTNLLLHTANGVLLFWLFSGMTGAVWRSAAVASFFALHPLHVESVAWISERKDVLSTLFALLTIWAYWAFVKQPSLVCYLVMFATYALGLMAKPMLVTLPFVLLLLDYWPLGRMNDEPGMTKQVQGKDQRAGALGSSSFIFHLSSFARLWDLISEKLPLFVLSASCCVITVLVQQPTQMISPTLRVMNAVLAYIDYIRLMFWPHPLAIFYPYRSEVSPQRALGAGLLLTTITILVLWTARRRPYLPVGWFWYLGTLVPVIGLLQVGYQAMADRYTYIPLVGMFIMLAWGLADLAAVLPRSRAVLAGALALLLIGCMLVTWNQMGYWRNGATLWQHALEVTNDNWAAHINVGVVLQRENHLDDAMTHFQEALRLKPDSAHGHRALGAAFKRLGRTDEAIAEYREAVRLEPYTAEGQYGLGVVLGDKGEREESIAALREAIRLKPEYPEAYNNLGVALARQGKFVEGRAALEEAIRLKPDYAPAHRNLGVLLEKQRSLHGAGQ